LGQFAIIAIGASMGGVDALQRLTAELPRDLPAAICVVQHIGRYTSQLPELLSRSGSLPALHARRGDAIRPGHIYVAPPDHHLLLNNGHIRLTRGPRENWARPAIDPLFRSAAKTYGALTVGVILTGMLNDGTAGLLAVRQAGGIAVVQDPHDAVAPDMPWSALRHAGADFRLPLDQIPPLLAELAGKLAITQTTPSDRRWRARP
jgi:two-component system, chemotaxis family, protein-glutamate methylesterase/glutaminase